MTTLTFAAETTVDPIQYVSPNGNDSNDGFSQGTAKLTIQAAITAAGANGCISVAPGSYSTASSITIKNGMKLKMSGVTVNYTGTGNCLVIQNVQNVTIEGLPIFNGPTTGGASIGMLFGIGSGGSGIVTAFNSVRALFKNFHVGVQFDGSSSNNGTYYNYFPLMISTANGTGVRMVPTAPNFVNSNRFDMLVVTGNVGDGLVVDGAQGMSIGHLDMELNGGWGANFPGTQATNSWTIQHVWGEGNTSGDFHSGSASNITEFMIKGGILQSTPNFSSTGWNGIGNKLEIQVRHDLYVAPGSSCTTHFGDTSANIYPILANDHTSPPSGIIGVLAYNIAGSNSGNLDMGTPEFPATFRSGAILTAPAPTVAAAQVAIGSTVAASASTGSNGAAPLQVAGYLIINVAGTAMKVPYYNT